MNAFSKIDMGEVTRLTQVGKLAEARATSMRVGRQSRFDRHVGSGGDRNADHRILHCEHCHIIQRPFEIFR